MFWGLPAADISGILIYTSMLMSSQEVLHQLQVLMEVLWWSTTFQTTLALHNKIARKWTAFESLKKTLTDGGMMSWRPGCPDSAVVVSVVALQWRSWSPLWIKILPRGTEDVAAAVADDNDDEVEGDVLIQSYWLMTNVNLWPLFWQHWFQKKKKKT